MARICLVHDDLLVEGAKAALSAGGYGVTIFTDPILAFGRAGGWETSSIAHHPRQIRPTKAEWGQLLRDNLDEKARQSG